MLGYLKVIIAVIIVLFLIYILFYKWETLGKPILFILVLWTIAVLIFKLIWEVLKFPITAFSEKYRFTDPSLFHVFFFYFIPIHLITCCFSLFLWFSKEHLLFWEEAKELIWALCPIANIFYALDIWIKLYLYLNALLFA